jgi:hypothetical protein
LLKGYLVLVIDASFRQKVWGNYPAQQSDVLIIAKLQEGQITRISAMIP